MSQFEHRRRASADIKTAFEWPESIASYVALSSPTRMQEYLRRQVLRDYQSPPERRKHDWKDEAMAPPVYVPLLKRLADALRQAKLTLFSDTDDMGLPSQEACANARHVLDSLIPENECSRILQLVDAYASWMLVWNDLTAGDLD